MKCKNNSVFGLTLVVLATGLIAAQQQQFHPGDPCKSKPCQNGICISFTENSTYHCYCEDGFTGRHCETDWNECWSEPCVNGGTCIDQIADFNCTCATGFKGKTCETNIDECLSDPCLNNGTCIDDIAGFTCECPIGFGGHLCEIDISVCNITKEKKCHNGGKCIDGYGPAFTCECSSGWTGRTCDDDVNECDMNPCLNGGMCMNAPGFFICSCPFGFTGETCEIELEKCDSNPCENDALCFVVDDSFECYCVPDFHGPRCQFKYDDCLLPPKPKCFNGGQCIDGVDEFSCSCPTEFIGTFCECSASDPRPECFVDEANVTTTSLWSSTAAPATVPEAFDIETGVTVGESTKDTEISSTLSSTTPGAKTGSSLGLIVPTPTLKPGDELDDGEEDGRTLENDTNVSPTPTMTFIPVTVITQTDFSTEIITSTSPGKTGIDNETSSVRPGPEITEPPITEVTEKLVPDLSMPMDPDISEDKDLTTTLQSVEGLPDDLNVTVSFDSTEEADVSSQTELADVSSQTEEADVSSQTEEADVSSEQSVTSIPPITEEILTTLTAQTAQETTIEPIDEDSQMSIDYDLDTTRAPKLDIIEGACKTHVCRNNGTCLNTITGPKCHCPLQFRGVQCEQELFVEVPGFVGHSMLVHQFAQNQSLSESGGFHMMISFVTSSPNGMIFYADGSHNELDMSAYIENGALNFKVSCGPQHILFSDPRQRVDTGFIQTLDVRMKVASDEDNPDIKKCVAIIRLNETHSMRGEQEIEDIPFQPSTVYFGQLATLDHQGELKNDVNGFHGCMKKFQWNKQDYDLFADAESGRDIVECKSAACATRPCQNGAVCTEHHETGSWFCNCQPGFTGEFCERPVCETNPCKSGGTCLSSKTGPGFLCLCPAGTKGVLCEQSMNISQPSFTKSVGGYSSYLSFPIYNPSSIAQRFSARFHFSTADVDQIALLFFLGQASVHEFGADYIAVSYVKGHILLTWDLGSGPRRIFTSMPVDERYFVHSVAFGREGRRGWLQVDQMTNITGRSPGLRENLNVSSQIAYLGGHVNHNFTFLPHDLPLHRGFEGCIFDFSLKSANHGTIIPLRRYMDPTIDPGRNVYQCHLDICASQPCQNQGTCVGYGSSYTCSCPDGWFGMNCQESFSACTIGKHKCHEGSKCTMHENGTYYCLCPFGKTGRFCHEDLFISDAKFTTHHSLMALDLNTTLAFSSHFEIDIKPTSSDGSVLYVGHETASDHQDFLSISIHNTSMDMTFSLGGPRGRRDHFLRLTLCCLKLDDWNRIRAGREGRQGYLEMDGKRTTGTALLNLHTLDVTPTLFLGNHWTSRRSHMDSHWPVHDHFQGCMRNLRVNGQFLPLSRSAGFTGWDIDDCDGSVCGGDVCHNRGTCNENPDKPGGFECECAKPYGGRRCEVHEICEDSDGCENGATCRIDPDNEDAVRCDCPFGFVGDKCEKAVEIESPKFFGRSHLRYEVDGSEQVFRDETKLNLLIKTEAKEGMILWIGEVISDEDYLGLGLRDGLLHLVWNLGWRSKSELTVPKAIDDGQWHSIEASRRGQAIDLVVDGEIFGSTVSGSYNELNVRSTVLLGGTPDEQLLPVLDLTRGHFRSGLVGCLQNVLIQDESLKSEKFRVSGSNVDEC